MSFKGSSIIYIFLFALLCACNKVELPDEQGPGTQPVLTTSMNIDGMAVDISAGLNDYVLHTGYELSDYNVLSMKSTFETIDHCDPTCASTLSVTLNAPLPYVQGQAFDVMDNIFVGDYPFAFDPILGQGDSLYMVYGFYSASFYSDLEIQWRRGNGPFMTLDGSVMFFDPSDIDFNELITLRLLDNGSVVAMHDFTLNETPLKYDYSCDFDLQYYSTGSTMELSAFMKGYANDYIINWNNDLIGQEQLYTYPNDLTSNWESIFVHVNSAQLSCAQSQSGAIRLNPSTGYGEAAFLSNGNMLVVTDYMQAEIFNAVYIEYTDESGLSYNSASIPQDLVFSILNVETFDIDENGNSTVKIDFSVDHVQLLSVSGESIDLTNFTGSIALAHPGT